MKYRWFIPSYPHYILTTSHHLPQATTLAAAPSIQSESGRAKSSYLMICLQRNTVHYIYRQAINDIYIYIYECYTYWCGCTHNVSLLYVSMEAWKIWWVNIIYFRSWENCYPLVDINVMNKENMQEQKMNSPLKQEIEMKLHYIKSINQSINQSTGSLALSLIFSHAGFPRAWCVHIRPIIDAFICLHT